MKVAIPIWNGRVSPVMDTALRLVVADAVDDRELSKTLIDIPQSDLPQRAEFISELGIDILVCGAVSRQFQRLLVASGVNVCPWMGGDVDEIIHACCHGNLQRDCFSLPGCGRRRGRRGRGRMRRLKEES